MQQAIANKEITELINAEYYSTHSILHNKQSVFTRFTTWCNQQEENRILWLVLSYLGQIGMALPCTLAAIIFMADNNFQLFVIACVINVPVLAINLAAQPTRITIPALLFSWVIDFAIIVSCALYFFTR